MIKKFYSKRSGFTLVEIVVAFAVFAIMAAMIAQILDLSIKARESNNLYARQLAQQERMLTVIQKADAGYSTANKTGDYTFKFADGTDITLGYQIKASDPSLDNQAEGINFFVSDVDYTCAPGEDGGTPSLDEGDSVGGSGMSQVARMDTRISGTSGIGKITFNYVIKDENTYPDGSPFKLAPGHTRYFFDVAASDMNIANDTTLLKQEDVGYSQFRLYFFYDEDPMLAEGGTDTDGKNYKKYVYKEMPIVEVGHIDDVMGGPGGVENTGLTASNTSSGLDTDENKNPYTVQKLGKNTVRIGSPFVEKDSKYGVRFKSSKPARFYVEFEGDPHLTTSSFGQNYVLNGAGDPVYTACPNYKDSYNTDGTPKYEKENESTHPSIYGAYLYKRSYTDSAE